MNYREYYALYFSFLYDTLSSQKCLFLVQMGFMLAGTIDVVRFEENPSKQHRKLFGLLAVFCRFSSGFRLLYSINVNIATLA